MTECSLENESILSPIVDMESNSRLSDICLNPKLSKKAEELVVRVSEEDFASLKGKEILPSKSVND